MSVSEEQVAFVREALRDELGLGRGRGAVISVTPETLDRLARVGISATLSYLIEATKDGKTGGIVRVNADDVIRGD